MEEKEEEIQLYQITDFDKTTGPGTDNVCLCS